MLNDTRLHSYLDSLLTIYSNDYAKILNILTSTYQRSLHDLESLKLVEVSRLISIVHALSGLKRAKELHNKTIGDYYIDHYTAELSRYNYKCN